LDALREGFVDLMSCNQKFIESIEKSTSSVQAVVTRFDLTRTLIQSIIGINTKEPRIFSHTIKETLYSKDPACSICKQKILNIDDSAVDHIEQYWAGGRTIPENARLTHRYCNWARPRKEDMSN